MKKILFLLFAFSAIISCKHNTPANQEQQSSGTASGSSTESVASANKIYGIKSGILISEMDMMGMGKATVENNFDDYGNVSLTNTKASIMSMNTVTHNLRKDGWMYVWTEGQKEGHKIKIDASQVSKENLDIDKLTQEMKDKMKLKEEGNSDVIGKSCKVYSMTISEKGMSMAGKVYVWEKLALKSEFDAKGMKISMLPKSLDEHPNFASGFFDVPAGITFTEMQNTGQADLN